MAKCLTKFFREAVLVPRILEICYLWVDSLGVIQDEGGDLARESSDGTHIWDYLISSTRGIGGSTGGLLPKDELAPICET